MRQVRAESTDIPVIEMLEQEPGVKNRACPAGNPERSGR